MFPKSVNVVSSRACAARLADLRELVHSALVATSYPESEISFRIDKLILRMRVYVDGPTICGKRVAMVRGYAVLEVRMLCVHFEDFLTHGKQSSDL